MLHYITPVYIYIKMIAAGSQSESPGGSAKAEPLCVLRFLSLRQCLTCAGQSQAHSPMCVTVAVTSGTAVWTECRS